MGAVLPLGAAIAVSAVPLIAFVLVLLTRRRVANGLAYALGTAGVLVIGAAFTAWLSSVAPGTVLQASGGGAGVLRLVFGVVLLVGGVLSWVRRPKKGAPIAAPRWFAKIDGIGARGAATLGVALAATNLKNLPLLLIVGSFLADAESFGAAVVSGAAFVAVACGVMGVLLLLVLLLPRAADAVLLRMRGLLIAHHAGILTTAFVLAGLLMIAYAVAAVAA